MRKDILDRALNLFELKIQKYGVSFAILRQKTLTDQILIKAQRIRNIQDRRGLMHVADESLSDSYMGVINYALIYLVKTELGDGDMSPSAAQKSYHRQVERIEILYQKKNADYGESWKMMRDESFIDMILQKLQRIRQLEDLKENNNLSIIDSYRDIVNYALFALIRMQYSLSEQ